MRMRLKKWASIMCAVCMMTTILIPNVSIAKNYDSRITREDLQGAEIKECYTTQRGEYKTLDRNGTIIYYYEDMTGYEEYAYNKDGKVIYQSLVNGEVQEAQVYSDEDFKVSEQEVSEAQLKIISETVEEGNFSNANELEQLLKEQGITYVQVEENEGAYLIDPFKRIQTRASNVDIGMEGLLQAFPAKDKTVSATRYFDARPEPTVRTLISCKDTRKFYVNTKTSTFSLAAGLSVVAAAAKVFMTPAKLSNVIGFAISVNKLVESVNLSRSMTAEATAVRQAWMYDRTNYMQDVIVYSITRTDYFRVGTASDSSPFAWYGDGGTLFNNISASTVIDNGISAWNSAIDRYGRWPWITV